MKVFPRLALMLALVIALTSCDSVQDITSPEKDVLLVQSPRTASAIGDEVKYGPYTISFIDREYDSSSNRTKFSYVLLNEGGPNVSHFLLEQPVNQHGGECAPTPVAFEPSNSVSLNTDQDTGIYGIKWKLNVPSTAPETAYAVYYPGEVFRGEIRTSIKSGNTVYYDSASRIAGPCQGFFSISGAVFIDGNQDAAYQPESESGISGIPISLSDSKGNTWQTTTGADGSYVFENLKPERYTVTAPTSLFGYIDPTTNTQYIVEIAPDATVDFGYLPSSGKIRQAFQSGELNSTGLPPKEWAKIFDTGIKGQRNATYSKQELLEFLDEIEGKGQYLGDPLALPDPFQFEGTDEQRLAAAYDILKMNARTDEQKFVQELLALELNFVAKLGPYDSAGLLADMHLSVIQWAESEYVAQLLSASKAALTTATTSFDSYDSMTLINRSGSGGIGSN